MVIDRKTDIKMPLRQFIGAKKGGEKLEREINAYNWIASWTIFIRFSATTVANVVGLY